MSVFSITVYTVLPFSINASAISRIRSPQSSGKDDSATSISCNKIYISIERGGRQGGREGERERKKRKGRERERKEGREGEETKREGGRVERERRGRGMDVP